MKCSLSLISEHFRFLVNFILEKDFNLRKTVAFRKCVIFLKGKCLERAKFSETNDTITGNETYLVIQYVHDCFLLVT